MSRLTLLEDYLFDLELLKNDIDQARTLVKQDKPLSPTQQSLLEIPAFFEGMALYLSPRKFKKLFGDEALTQYDELKISNIIASIELKKHGGLNYALRTNDQYTTSELTTFLENISASLKDKSKVAIDFSAHSHSVGVRVLDSGKFRLVNTNGLKKIKKEYTASELAEKLKNSFKSSNQRLLLSTTVFTNQENSFSLDHLKNIEPLSDLALDENGDSLLQIAALTNDIATIKRIPSQLMAKISVAKLNDALLGAVMTNSHQAAELLLNLPGMNVNRAHSHNSPLEVAILKKNYPLAKKIAEHPSFDANLVKARALENHKVLPFILEKIALTRKDLDSGLIQQVVKCDNETQKKWLLKALTTYMNDRNNQANYLNFFGCGIHKVVKLDAAKALLYNLKGFQQDLNLHLEALEDGLLSTLYDFYKIVSYPALDLNNMNITA